MNYFERTFGIPQEDVMKTLLELPSILQDDSKLEESQWVYTKGLDYLTLDLGKFSAILSRTHRVVHNRHRSGKPTQTLQMLLNNRVVIRNSNGVEMEVEMNPQMYHDIEKELTLAEHRVLKDKGQLMTQEWEVIKVLPAKLTEEDAESV